MESAWFGLLGVIVGALISTLSAFMLATRQELGDGVVAARLLRAELSGRLAVLKGEAPEPAPILDVELWHANRSALARVLSYWEWEVVSGCFPAAPGEAEVARLEEADGLLLKWRDKRSAVLKRIRHFFNLAPRKRKE